MILTIDQLKKLNSFGIVPKSKEINSVKEINNLLDMVDDKMMDPQYWGPDDEPKESFFPIQDLYDELYLSYDGDDKED